MKTRYLIVAATAALAAGCVPRPQPAPEVPQPRDEAPPPPTPPVPAPPAPGWEDAPLSQGNWYYSREGTNSQAGFGAPNSEAQFVLRCDRARRQVVLSREGVATQPALTVRTSAGDRRINGSQQTDPLAYLSAALPASDRFLDAMVFSRGRFAVEASGLPRLVLPAWPEPARVIEDCRE